MGEEPGKPAAGKDPDATRSVSGETLPTVRLPADDSRPAADGAATLEPGDHVGRFAVLGQLGAGGMGVVYGAYDPELDRRVALKRLSVERERSPEARLRLLREAQAMARLSHPNVVAVHDVVDTEPAIFLAMEYVQGQTLDDWLQERPRGWRAVRDVLVQAGRGLAAAHRVDLVHRDFKPGNLLVDADGRARVTDFGIARLRDGDDAHGPAPADAITSGVTPLSLSLTRTGTAVGTPAYMAPEQHRGGAVDARADQFAFCVTAWEALYGERPFAGRGAELLAAITAGQLRTPRPDRDVPSWIAPLLRRGLADDPAERWPAMEALLERLADDPVIRRRRRIALGAALVAVAGIAGGASWMAAAGSSGDPDDPAAACAATGDELAAIWNPGVQAAAGDAFRATGAPEAADSWARASRGIGDWTGRWSAARRGACEAHARRQQSDELYDRRMTCLDRQRNRLAALTDLLQKPDADLVREAVAAVLDLPPPADCADAEALLAQRPPPADPQLRDQVAAVRVLADRATTLDSAGRPGAALKVMKEATGQARDLDYPPLQAELLHATGQFEDRAGDPRAAEATLRRAAEMAARAGDLPLYARTRISLVWVVGAKQGRFDDSRPLRETAAQAVALAGEPADLLDDLLIADGACLYIHGDYKDALPILVRAVAVSEAAHGSESVELVSPLNLLGATQSEDDAQLAASIASYERALRILVATMGPDHPRVGTISGNLGNSYFSQGQISRAIELHRRALKIAETTLGGDATELGAPLLGLANALWSLDQLDEAYALNQRALAIWEKAFGPKHPYVAAALTNLGGVRAEQDRCGEALAPLDRSLGILTALHGPDHANLSMTLGFKGHCLIELGRHAEARATIQRAMRNAGATASATTLAGWRFELARIQWATGGDRRAAVATAIESLEVMLADPGDRAETAAGARGASQKISEWLAGKD